MTAETDDQRRQRKHARERDETALEAVIGEEAEANRRKCCDDERQRRAMHGAQE